MGRNAETELLDDIVDLFKPYDHTSDIADPIARDIVDLVKGRLVSPDEMDLIQDTIQAAYDATEVANSATTAALDSLRELATLMPEKMVY